MEYDGRRIQQLIQQQLVFTAGTTSTTSWSASFPAKPTPASYAATATAAVYPGCCCHLPTGHLPNVPATGYQCCARPSATNCSMVISSTEISIAICWALYIY